MSEIRLHWLETTTVREVPFVYCAAWKPNTQQSTNSQTNGSASGLRAEGQGTAPQRCLIAMKRSQTTSLALKQQRWGASTCPSPWGLCLLHGICNSMHETQKPLFLWTARGMQEPARARQARWTHPATHQGLLLWLLQLFAHKASGEMKLQLPVLWAQALISWSSSCFASLSSRRKGKSCKGCTLVCAELSNE